MKKGILKQLNKKGPESTGKVKFALNGIPHGGKPGMKKTAGGQSVKRMSLSKLGGGKAKDQTKY